MRYFLSPANALIRIGVAAVTLGLAIATGSLAENDNTAETLGHSNTFR